MLQLSGFQVLVLKVFQKFWVLRFEIGFLFFFYFFYLKYVDVGFSDLAICLKVISSTQNFIIDEPQI